MLLRNRDLRVTSMVPDPHDQSCRWKRWSGSKNLLHLAVCVLVVLGHGYCLGSTDSPKAPDPLVVSGFDRFYNMDYDRAVQDFEKVAETRANDATALNHLLSAVLMRELYAMGALNTGEYAGNSFIGQAHRPADPKVKERIRQLAQRAEALEEQELKINPDDVEALYARGVTRAQVSLYTGLLERAWFSALRNAVGARHDHERVLELNPHYVQAKLVVGTHNYVMGSLPWSVKAAVALVGLAGSKEKGLEYLKEVGESHTENSVDAEIVLALFLRREGRLEEARSMIRTLVSHYPRNYLLALEDAHLLRAGGQTSEAAAAYRAVFQAGQDGKYGRLHYEIAAYSLGELLKSQKDYGGAEAAFEQVSTAVNPDAETLQKANLAAGEMYDALGKRDAAMKKYRIVVVENGGTAQAEAARKCMQSPCR